MKFEFEHLGPISQGEIELGKLTVFCGKNNTGKTYVSYLIYGFLYFLRENVTITDNFSFGISVDNEEDEIGVINIDAWISELSILKEKIESSFVEYLPNVFNVDRDKIKGVSVLFGDSEGNNQVSRETVLNEIEVFTSNVKDVNIESIENEKLIVRIDTKKGKRSVLDACKVMCYMISLDLLFDYRLDQIYMLPAERSGLNMFYRELNLNRNNVFYGLMSKKNTEDIEGRIAKYPLPISEYINLLNRLDSEGRNVATYSELAATLEKKIVCGKFSISQNGSILFHIKDKQNLDFHLSSSTAKSLFGLDYLLKNELYKGCILIIDEPEQNLHPDNQRYIARLLCKLANAGVDVIVSTHSDYIVREINNLIILGNRFNGYKKLMEEYGYEEDELITKDEVSGYIFKDQTIDKVTVDDKGMQMDVFDDVINSMNEASDDIYFTYREECENDEEQDDIGRF